MKTSPCIIRFSFCVLTALLFAGCSSLSKPVSEHDIDPRKMAYMYTLVGRYDDAVHILEESILGDPQNNEMLTGLLYCYLKSGNQREAERFIKNYQDSRDNPGYEFYHMRGRLSFDNKQFSAALDDFNAGIDLLRESVDQSINEHYVEQCKTELDAKTKTKKQSETYHIRDTETDFVAQDIRSARNEFEKAQSIYKLNKIYTDMLIRRAYIHASDGRYEQAERDYDEAVTFDPSNLGIYAGKALLYKSQDNFDAALANYTTALSLAPDNPELHFQRSQVYEQMGRYADAYYDCAQASQRDPHNSRYVLGKAKYLYVLEEYYDAIADISRYIDMSDTTTPQRRIQAYSLRGAAYWHVAQYKKSAEDFSTVIAIDPNNLDAHYNRGIALNALNMSDRAIKDLEFVAQHDPDNVQVWCELGIAFLALGSKGNADMRAGRSLEKAIRVAPQNYRAYAYLGYWYYREGVDDSLMFKYLEQAVALNPTYAQPYLFRAFYYRDKGRYDEALMQLDTIIALQNDMYKAYFHKAVIYELKRNKNNAISNYEKVIEYAPDQEDRKVMIARKRINALKML